MEEGADRAIGTMTEEETTTGAVIAETIGGTTEEETTEATGKDLARHPRDETTGATANETAIEAARVTVVMPHRIDTAIGIVIAATDETATMVMGTGTETQTDGDATTVTRSRGTTAEKSTRYGPAERQLGMLRGGINARNTTLPSHHAPRMIETLHSHSVLARTTRMYLGPAERMTAADGPPARTGATPWMKTVRWTTMKKMSRSTMAWPPCRP